MPKITGDPDFLLVNAFIKTGDEDAFTGIMLKYQDQVFNYCFRFLGNEADAGDCSQEIFIKVFKNLGRFRQKSKFSSWLFRIMINTCNEMLRSKSYRQGRKKIEKDISDFNSAKLIASPDKSSFDPEHRLLSKQLDSEFQKALLKLNERQRKMIIMRDIEGRSYDEMAGLAGINLGTVRSTLARARAKMAEELKQFRNAM